MFTARVIIPDGFGQVSLVHEGGGIDGQAVCTLGFRNDAGASASAASEIIGDLWVPVVESMMVETVAFVLSQVKLGPNSTGALGETAYSQIGDQGGDQASPQTAVLVQKTTNLGGRHGRGRMYVPGAPDLLGENTGLWDGGAITQWTTDLGTFSSAMTTAELVPVLLHATSSPVPTPLTGLVPSARSATQRRRNRR